MAPRTFARSAALACAQTSAVLALAAACGCSGALPSPAVVTKLRLFALTADTPESRPGADVRVTAVWYDGAVGPPREVYFLWRLCPAGADINPPSCLQPAQGTDLRVDTASHGADAITVPGTALPFAPVGADPHATNYVLLVAMCPVAAPAYDPVAGQYACPSEAAVPDELREGIQAVRQLTVRDTGPLNQNPGIARVTVAGQDAAGGARVTVAPCADTAVQSGTCPGVALAIYAASDAVEQQPDGTPETLLASFFVTAGSTDEPRAVASDGNPLGMDGSLGVTWYPPASPGPVMLWFVLRDGRGGDTAQRVEVDVGGP